MIVQFAGLPGTGKSTLAAAVDAHFSDRALLLDKDRVRAAHFGRLVDYSRDQDDFCVELMFATAAWHLSLSTEAVVIFDGRTCSRSYQIARVRAFAEQVARPLRVVECTCREETARARLDRDANRHPAANRDFALYQQLRDTAEPLAVDRRRVDTDHPLDRCLEECLEFLLDASAPKEPCR